MPTTLRNTDILFNDNSTLTSGNIPAANLGSGTADSTTFLRGDRTWQTISTTPTTAQVLSATAGASVGAVGTYAFLRRMTSGTSNPGNTLAGSSLRYSNANGQSTHGYGTPNPSPAGTWRCMARIEGGTSTSNVGGATGVWLRVS